MISKMYNLALSLLLIGGVVTVSLDYEDTLGGELAFSGGGAWVEGRADDKSKTVRHLKVFVGDIIDSVEWGVGNLDNSDIQYYSGGGPGGQLEEFLLNEGDWIETV